MPRGGGGGGEEQRTTEDRSTRKHKPAVGVNCKQGSTETVAAAAGTLLLCCTWASVKPQRRAVKHGPCSQLAATRCGGPACRGRTCLQPSSSASESCVSWVPTS